MAQRVGKVTDFTVPDNANAPIRCKVGGEPVKCWRTSKADGMEQRHPVAVLLHQASGDGSVVLVTGEEDQRSFFSTKANKDISIRDFMASSATLEVPEGATHIFDLDKRGNPIGAGVTTANTLNGNGHKNGSIPSQEFTGREPGTYDRMFLFSECIRHAILAAEEGGPFSEMPVLDRAKFFFDAVQDSVKSAETKAAEQVAEAF